LIAAATAGCRDNASASLNVPVGKDDDPGAKIVYRKDGVAEVSFDSLKFDIRRDEDYQESMMTAEIKALDGKPIVIRGFILPGSVYQDTGFDQFVLIRDNQQCCFGPGAKIYHNMQVEMAAGKTADFSTRPVTVEGEFHLRPWYGPDKKCYSIFHVTATRVTR
jgi:hypothetical protein